MSFAELARVTTASALLAAVRSATPGMMVAPAACAPFSAGQWLFSHNGVIAGWPHSVASLAASLDVVELLTLDAPTDSALLWALLRGELQNRADPAAALAATLARVLEVAAGSRLNVLLTDGRTVYATSIGHSLAVHHAPGRVVVASEPIDSDQNWHDVPDYRLVVADPQHYRMEAL